MSIQPSSRRSRSGPATRSMALSARERASGSLRARWPSSASSRRSRSADRKRPLLDRGRSARQEQAMTLAPFITWLSDNRQGLVLGLAVGAGLVVAMLLLRAAGRSLVARDPHGIGWRTVIGRV